MEVAKRKVYFPEFKSKTDVHQILNSIRNVASKNQKEFIKDLKLVYPTISKEVEELELTWLEEKWGSKYPIVIQSWRNKWKNLSHYFKYPADIRLNIYMSNIIESVGSVK